MIIIYYLLFLLLNSLLLIHLQRLIALFVLLYFSATLLLLIAFSAPTLLVITIGFVFILLWLLIHLPSARLWLLQTFAQKIMNTTISISETERIAMQSGQTHWEQNLFSANLNWHTLLAVKSSDLSAAEQAFITAKVPQLIQKFYQYGLSAKTLDIIKQQGFWSFNIPAKYGGLEFSAKAHTRILEQLSACDISLAVSVMVPNSLGPAELILRYGTDEQKQNLLPQLACGEQIPCFALTSTEAGSDATAMTDTGVICYQQYQHQKTLGIRLNWHKRYTTLAPIATLIGLAFKTYDPDKLLSDKTSIGISCALVDAGLDGVSIGRYHHPIGANFANGPHSGDDVFIPLSAVIGGKKMLGKGWQMLMECLSLGRGLSLPALSLSGVQISLKSSLEYSLIRRQFKQSLYKFGGIAEKIVPMAADLLQMQAMSDLHITLLDKGLNPSISSAILKYHHTQALRVHINSAMDIQAGKAVMLGKSNYLANIYQTIPIAITVEGANILTRSMIIFGQGLLRCHPFLNAEIEQLNQQNIPSFNRLLGKHLEHIIVVKVKSFLYGLIPAFAPTPNTATKITKPYYQQLAALSAGFAFLVEIVLVKYAHKLKFQESINGLFADVFIRLYALSTTLRFYAQNPANQHRHLIQWIGQTQIHQIQLSLLHICQQFRLGFLFKIIVLPRGIQSPPNSAKQAKLMHDLITDTALKKQLTKVITSSEQSHPQKQLQQAFELAIKAENIYKKVGFIDNTDEIETLFKQRKISQEDYDLLIKLKQLNTEVLAVDDYKNRA